MSIRIAMAIMLVCACSVAPSMGASKSCTTKTSLQHTVSVDVGPVGVTRSCDLANKKNCSTSISISGGGATASISSNGDACVGGSLKGGAGVYGKVSGVSCGNILNGSSAGKLGGAVGVGLGADAGSVGGSTGITATNRQTCTSSTPSKNSARRK